MSLRVRARTRSKLKKDWPPVGYPTKNRTGFFGPIQIRSK
jgi:hypothetical protein